MESVADTVRRAAAGDREAFGALVVAHRDLVVGIGRGILRDDHEAEDAAQETFVRAWLRLGDLGAPTRFPGWLRSVARSVALNRLRGRRPEHRLGDDAPARGPDPATEAEVGEFARSILRAIEELPDGWRTPLEVFHLEGGSLRDVADRLGIGEGSARMRLSRARKRLASVLVRRWSIEAISRGKESRGWLPAGLAPPGREESDPMALTFETTLRRLPRGDREVTIRPLRREDLPALRRFDRELDATLADSNAALPPGLGSEGGGPWSQDDWLLAHFERYEARGNLTLLAEEAGRIVGFADLWVADEPAPFGGSLDVECIDYFREHYLLGLETVFLSEAERVARAAGLPSLDIGTNTVSGDYVPLRRFGLRVFYEYDEALCRPGPAAPSTRPPETRPISGGTADLSGLLKVSHWSPTDFGFRDENPWGGGSRLVEIRWPDRRAILELWRFEDARAAGHPPVPPNVPNRAELYVSAECLDDARAVNEVLAEGAALAADAGADEIPLPVPCDVEIDPDRVVARDREFRFAWFRKRLD